MSIIQIVILNIYYLETTLIYFFYHLFSFLPINRNFSTKKREREYEYDRGVER